MLRYHEDSGLLFMRGKHQQLELASDVLKILERDLKERTKNVKAHATSQYNPGWNTCLDLRNMLISAEATAMSALTRQESRGAHTRLDFEGEREEGLAYNCVVRRAADGSMELRKEPRPEPPAELAKIANASIEDLEANRV